MEKTRFRYGSDKEKPRSFGEMSKDIQKIFKALSGNY
jgi:hypothetical protein